MGNNKTNKQKGNQVMKKNIALWLVLALCASLFIACGKKDADTTNKNETVEDTVTEDTNDDVVTEEETEDAVTEDTTTETEPEQDVTEEPEQDTTEDEVVTEPEEEQPEVEQPETEEPEVQEPEVEAPEQNSGSVDLMAIFEALANAYGENFIPTMLMNAANEYDLETLNMMIWVADENGDGQGLSADLYDEYVAATPMIGFHPDTVIMIKAKEGKMPEVMAFLEALKESKVDPMNNYPSNLPKQQAIRIETYGDYVFFYTLGAPNDTETDEAALLEYYTEQNQIASDIIAGFFK